MCIELSRHAALLSAQQTTHIHHQKERSTGLHLSTARANMCVVWWESLYTVCNLFTISQPSSPPSWRESACVAGDLWEAFQRQCGEWHSPQLTGRPCEHTPIHNKLSMACFCISAGCSAVLWVLPPHCGCCRDAVVYPGYRQHVSYGGHTSPFLWDLYF